MPAACESGECAARAGGIDLSAPVDARRAGQPPQPRPVSHLEWARNIAAKIAALKRLGPQETADVLAHASFTLVRKLRQFSPKPRYAPGENVHGHFRGWVWFSLRAECLREIKRLKKGGTLPPSGGRSEGAKNVRVEGLPFRRTECGVEEVELAARRESPDVEEPEPGERRRWDESGRLTANWTLKFTRHRSRRLWLRLVAVEELARAGEPAELLSSPAIWLTLLGLA